MAPHRLFRAVRVACCDGIEDRFVPCIVHLVDIRTALHGTPVLDEPFHISLVNGRINGIAGDPVEDGVEVSIGFVELG